MKTIEEINLKELIELETRESFNRNGYICCPFHNEKTPSLKVRFNPNSNKYTYKCFGCGVSGDSIDFIKAYRNLDYNQAREYLGIEVEKTPIELEKDKIQNYISWQISNREDYKGYKLIGLFQFTDKTGKPVYYKAKLLKPDGKKITPYYHIEDEKVVSTRLGEELLYNLHNVVYGIRNNKPIVVVEGEKDANTINNMLRRYGYVATSIKGVKNLDILVNEDAKYIVIGDTGEAGEKYIQNIKEKLMPIAASFKIVTLPGLKSLGNNKDVTDWIEAGHTKEELLLAFKKSLDLKSMYELQQDEYGIYMPRVKKDDNGKDVLDGKIRYTDFQILGAYRLNLVEEEKEGIRLILKSFAGKVYEKTGNSNIFNDVKSFRNFLGTMDLNFLMDKTKEVVKMGKWINDYIAVENEEIYKGVQFLPIGDKLYLTTKEGAITPNGIDLNIKNSKDSNDVNFMNTDFITKEEMQEAWQHITRFIPGAKALTVLGTIINNMCVYQASKLNIAFHHLLIVGESGSGKSDVLKKYIAPILNIPISEIKGIGNTTAWAMDKDLTTGNYTKIYDEFKPSMFSNQAKMKNISDTLRSLFDRSTISKGGKDFRVRDYRYMCPIVLAGEESYPNSETALMTRSAIVYISPGDRTEKSINSYKWIDKNEEILNKFGKSILNIVLNLSIDDYKAIREEKVKYFNLKNRVLNTALNVSTGIEIYNKLLCNLGLENLQLKDYEKLIEDNLKEEVLDGQEESSRSLYEQMLLLFDDMAQNNRVRGFSEIVRKEGNELYIRTTEMINQICSFCKTVGSAEIIPLKARDFKKQATKGGYVSNERKQLRIYDYTTNESAKYKRVWFDEYNIEKIRNLGCTYIAGVSEEDSEIDRFNKKLAKEGMPYNRDNVIQGGFGV